jgi:hypothetical protein
MELLQYLQNSIQAASELSRGKPFLEIFKIYKKYLRNYANALANKIHSYEFLFLKIQHESEINQNSD